MSKKYVKFIGNNGNHPYNCYPNDSGFTVGKIYEMSSVCDDMIFVVSDDDGESNGWDAEYFESVPDQPSEKSGGKREDGFKIETRDPLDDRLDVLRFLYFKSKDNPNDLWGAIKAKDAFSAMCRILNVNEQNIEDVFNT